MTAVRDTDLTNDLRELVLARLGVDLIGVAPVERMAGAPEGSRPTDYMPNAKAVVVLAGALPRAILEAAVGRQALPPALTANTPLLGHLTELDSMAVLSVLTQIQEELGCEIADDDISADLFETYGTLRQLVAAPPSQ